MNYIATATTPTYTLNIASGFYTHAGSLATGTEITLASKGVDAKSGREVGYLANGKIVYLDALQPVTMLDEIEVRSTRLWGWLAGLAVTGAAIGYGVYKYKQSQKINKK
jgi:hypothetical protein